MSAAREREAAPANTLLALDRVQVHFGPVRALDKVSLTLHANERVALIGGNGSGKSTLLRVMHGLLRPDRGQLFSPNRPRQAMLFQRPHMLRTTSLNNVVLGLWLRGTPWRQARAMAGAALARVGLADVALRRATGLSGGQQQRLALARAWVLAPELLLLDEPTASLDPHAKREVEALMDELAHGMTLVFASHNLGQVKRLASRVVYLEQGRVLADLPVDEFFGGTLLARHYREAHWFVKGEMS